MLPIDSAPSSRGKGQVAVYDFVVVGHAVLLEDVDVEHGQRARETDDAGAFGGLVAVGADVYEVERFEFLAHLEADGDVGQAGGARLPH